LDDIDVVPLAAPGALALEQGRGGLGRSWTGARAQTRPWSCRDQRVVSRQRPAEYLGEVGVMGAEEPLVLSPVEALVIGYRQWLTADRGFAAITVLRYETLARRFLTARVTPTDELGVTGLDGAVVSRFLLVECERVCLGSAKGKVAELRSLLRFPHVRGFTPRSLAESVPGVAGWRDTTIPPTMPQADIEALIASCDRTTLDGARDRAMLMLLARLGLRSIEIARLQLDDLDWRAGDLLVRGKARRDDRLPIPNDVGKALAEYLALRGRGRPRPPATGRPAVARGSTMTGLAQHLDDYLQLRRRLGHKLEHAHGKQRAVALRSAHTRTAVSSITTSARLQLLTSRTRGRRGW
jgi:integrase